MSELYLIYKEQTGSTNDDLLKLAVDGAREGTAVVTDYQINGKGRRGRKWSAESGLSAIVSILLRPEPDFRDTNLLAPMTAVAASRVISEVCDLEVKIKWPNDLMVNERKLAGILVEGRHTSAGLAIVAGIGVNVRQESFTEDIAQKAISIKAAGGKNISPKSLAELIALRILHIWEKWDFGGRQDVLKEWTLRLWGCGRTVLIESAGELMECVIDGVEENGSLIVYTKDGDKRSLISADSVSLRQII